MSGRGDGASGRGERPADQRRLATVPVVAQGRGQLLSKTKEPVEPIRPPLSEPLAITPSTPAISRGRGPRLNRAGTGRYDWCPALTWGGAVKIAVDGSLCSGHGRCYSVAADLLQSDDYGFVTIKGTTMEVPPGQEDAARQAAGWCPEQAITVED
jgi:ferredoxin